MTEWEVYLKKNGESIKENLGVVVAESSQETIELYFEPENINIEPGTSIEITEVGVPSNNYKYKARKLKKV